LFVKDFKGNDPRWVYYLLDSIDFSAYNSGSAQPSLNRNYLAKIPVFLPTITEQREIAATLGALDDKIESDRTVERLIWELLEAEHRALSAGRSDVPLRDLMRLEYGKSLPAAARIVGDVPVFGSNGITGMHNVPIIDGPAVIVGRKGSIGEVHWSHIPCFPIDTTFYVAPANGYPLLTCYFALRGAGLRHRNSDSAIPGLNREGALGVGVSIAPLKELTDWAENAQSLLHELAHVEEEIRILTGLRDALLPELLSGRIRIPEAQEAVAEVSA
jgi:type I restriction enzyme S subunit